MAAVSRRRMSSVPVSAYIWQIIILMDGASAISIQASASRQIFAFARDEGTPFAPWLSRVCCCLFCDGNRSNTDPQKGQPSPGRSFQCGRMFYDDCLPALLDQHRKYGRLQQLNLPDQRYTHGVLWHLHRLLCMAQVIETTHAALTISAWPIWSIGESASTELSLGGVRHGT